MDENLKLLLTLGSGAAVGTVFTGLFMLIKTAVDTKAEHRQAMRNERIKIYVDFLAAIQEEVWTIQNTSPPQTVRSTFPVAHLAKIDALGSRTVRLAAGEYARHKNLYELVRRQLVDEGEFLGIPGPNRKRITEQYAEAHKRLIDLGEDLIRVVRKDLRTPNK